MNGALGDLVDVLVNVALYRVVSEVLRDQPAGVVAVVGVLAAVLFLGRRVRRRNGFRSGRVSRR